ncbi:MAG TPA: hypothetical protein VFT61_11350 [Sphingomicrobium sp.]|nr:hypothetical protein [Sphingomicrobium sp.]
MMIGLYLLLNFAVLWLVARSAAATGWALTAMLLLLGLVVGSANNLLEAVVYGVLSLRQALAAAVPAAIVFAILSPLAVLLAGRWKNGSEAEAIGVTPIKLLIVVAAYEVLYWTAGILVYPYIAHFYTTKTIPPVYEVASLQVVRSLIFFAAGYPLMKSGLRSAPLVMGLVYGVVGGIAPLLPDNPYMPADIRFYHGIETSVSNFLFGLIVGYVFTRARPLRPVHA